MLIWEDSNEIHTFKKIISEIETIGYSTRHFRSRKQNIKNIWTLRFKVWEYPFAYLWLEKLSKNLNLDRKLKVMDFGCGYSILPKFLASKGFEVWGIDNDSHNLIAPIRKKMDIHYSDVSYWIGEIFDFDLTDFDAIISCSTLEHIAPQRRRIRCVKKLKKLLKPQGKMMHIVDYYFPKSYHSNKIRVNFYKLAKVLNFNIGHSVMCPGSPDFNFEKVKQKTNFIMPKNRTTQARIAIGDDI